MFVMRASGAAASWVVGRVGTDAHLYDDPEDAAIPALLDSRFDGYKVDASASSPSSPRASTSSTSSPWILLSSRSGIRPLLHGEQPQEPRIVPRPDVQQQPHPLHRPEVR